MVGFEQDLGSGMIPFYDRTLIWFFHAAEYLVQACGGSLVLALLGCGFPCHHAYGIFSVQNYSLLIIVLEDDEQENKNIIIK